MEPVGEFALEFEPDVINPAAATEGGLQFAEKAVQLPGCPRGGEALEHEDGLAAAMGGGPAEEEVLFPGWSRLTCGGRRACGWRVGLAALDVERSEGIGEGGGGGLGGDALFLFPRHSGQRSQPFFLM